MKGKIADINELITSPIEKFGVLLYGPNEYRVNKNYIKIYDELNKHNDEMLEAQELDANIILNQAETFFNEINTINLGGGIKVVKIDLTDTDKAGCLENYLENPTDNSFIVVKSGKLGPKSKLRGLFEKSESFIVIPFYEDTLKDTNIFIENYMNSNKLSITHDAKQKIISFAGQNNKVLESNLELIFLYMLKNKEKEIDIDIINKVLFADKPVEIQNLCNSVALGKIDDAFFCFNKLSLNGQQPIQVINALSSFFQRIHNALIAMENGKNLTQAMSELRPPVFFKEKDNFTKQLKLWNINKAERALTIINEGETDIKKSPELANTISGNIVLRLTAAAAK